MAEVHNTFGERWPYLLGEPRELDGDGRMRFSTEKRFHVSPFMDVSGTYRFLLGEPGERLMLRIDEELDGERLFRAVLTGERRPLTSGALAHALRALPLGHRAGHGAHPLAGAEAVAQARAVPPQAAVRPRARLDADMSRVERESVAAPRTRPGLVGAASRGACSSARSSGIEDGALETARPDGTRRFGDPAADAVVLEVHDPRFFARLARSGRLAVGEGYQAGEWSSPDLPALVALLARNHEQVFGRPPLSLLARLGRLVPRVELPRGLRRAERDVHAHYDLGNAFFALWLDESMTYSCALFESPGATLAEAQQAKYRALADATQIGAGDHVLEIGTGWGGFALHLARERGCRVTTATISREQHALATGGCETPA